MATIHYKKAFTMSIEEVREGIEKLGQGLQSHGLKYHWENAERAVFSHKGGKGFIVIKGNQVELELKLQGFKYAAMAPLIKNRIVSMAEEYIS